jgi:predicted ATPase/class 3 adenylate cyclase
VLDRTAVTTFLFSDIEGSTRLWESETERMRGALSRHDALARTTVDAHRGAIFKMTGDGFNAAFGDPADALDAAITLQRAIADPAATEGIGLRVRCGLHVGIVEHRDNDYFGRAVNRAARIMAAAHGGQVLVSQAIATLIGERLPADVALRDLGAVRLRDLGNPEHVFQVTHPQLRSDFPPLRALESTPNNLPQQVTSFIGRERELEEVAELLRKTRLLTLAGAGGLGKTRLSLQLAADLMDDYPDGVWFVELAPLTDAGRVPQAVASVLGVKEDAGKPVIEAVLKHIRDRKLLLILDNCEHLAHACAEVAVRLLHAGPNVKVLASSREHLHVTGEALFQVPSLAVPAPDEKITLTALTQYEAVHFFIDRAVAKLPSFRLTEQNATAVSDICRRLDGIPLALELAAARVRAMSVEKIAERLSDRFRLLTGGDRTALPRQQTLRASIDWSYDLLPEPERALLRRLAVFAGGWTLEAAETVASKNGVEESDVLDLLSRLVEKSLVELEAEGERYRLLETVRQYAQEKLSESGDEAEARTRHLAYYLSFAEKARTELVGRDQAAWLARLDFERENLLTAHAWCDRAEGGGELGLRLVQAVKQYQGNRGLWALRHRMAVEALARPGAQRRSQARCTGLFNAGQACCFMGRYGEATKHLEESLAIARELEDRDRVGAALQLLGMASFAQGDLATARRHLEEGLMLARETGNKYEVAAATNGLAQVHRVEGALDAAEPLYETVLALARELGDREIVAVGLLNLAMVSIARGSGTHARAMLLDVHAIVQEIGSTAAGQSVLEVSAGLASMHEEWARAARYFGAAESQAVQTGLRRDPADEAFVARMIAKARNALDAASFAAAESAGRALPYDAALADARAWLEEDRIN